jgi:hypothetical protein
VMIDGWLSSAYHNVYAVASQSSQSASCVCYKL